MANLGELLAELRHDRGLKQEELADILHLSKSTISSYERGQQLPPLDKYEIAANLGIKPDSVRMALTRARKAAYALLAKE